MSLASTIMNVQFEAPVRFGPSVERPGADEVETTQALIATIDIMRFPNVGWSKSCALTASTDT
jgi:hypothetical protein